MDKMRRTVIGAGGAGLLASSLPVVVWVLADKPHLSDYACGWTTSMPKVAC